MHAKFEKDYCSALSSKEKKKKKVQLRGQFKQN
jgi:hypothetical protein